MRKEQSNKLSMLVLRASQILLSRKGWHMQSAFLAADVHVKDVSAADVSFSTAAMAALFS